MTIRLRPHHLLCMLTYIGEGYSKAFTENYDHIVVRLAAGEDIVIVDGPDDICAPRHDDPAAHCLETRIAETDGTAAASIAALLGAPIAAGSHLQLDAVLLAKLRQAFAKGTIRSACSDCQWSTLCDRIVASGFDTTRLQISHLC